MFELKNTDSEAFIEEYDYSVLRKISFQNAEIYHNGSLSTEENINICYDTMSITENNGIYILEIHNYLSDDFYKIKFDNISVLFKAYCADSDPLFWIFVKNPWDYITSLANCINSHLKYDVANEKEKKLFGLVSHLSGEQIAHPNEISAELYNLIEKHGLQKVIKPPYDLSSPYLSKRKFEPLFRDILKLLEDSQRGLPSYFEEIVTKEVFEKHKKLINKEMNSWGYTGTYPDFYKKDSIKKPTMFNSYNLSYIVTYEKHVEHHIRCYSFKTNGVIQTAFFTGTIFNKKSTDTSDIYSTMFDCNGRSVFAILSTLFDDGMNDKTYKNHTINAVKAAVKKADLKKADKFDYAYKGIFDRNPSLNFKALFLMFLFFSVGFSLITPLLLFILEGSSPSEIYTFLKSEPLALTFGPLGGFIATFLVGLFEWKSFKK